MDEEDLVRIERLLKQRVYVNLPADEWSASMTKAMLDKIPELVAEIRRQSREKEATVKDLEGMAERMKA